MIMNLGSVTYVGVHYLLFSFLENEVEFLKYQDPLSIDNL